MRIFVTGASGWIGSAVVPELISAGHQVLGLARSDASAKAVADMGAEVLRGDLNDTGVLRAGALDSDGVIHLAFVVPSVSEAATRTDAKAIETFAAGLAGSGKPLVISGATLVDARPTRDRTRRTHRRRDPSRPASPTCRPPSPPQSRGVRSCLVMLPRSVHGQGERHGFIPQLIAMARAKGVSGYIGDGTSRWPAVHVKDAASLYRLAIEQAPAGAVLNAVGDEGVPVREIAEAIGRHLNLPARSLPAEEFERHARAPAQHRHARLQHHHPGAPGLEAHPPRPHRGHRTGPLLHLTSPGQQARQRPGPASAVPASLPMSERRRAVSREDSRCCPIGP